MDTDLRKPLCFIPARGGSKRLIGKNRALLAGKPLLQWTIDCAFASGVFENIIVSSEHAGILDIATSSGATALYRDDSLATDDTTLLELCLTLVPELAASVRATDLYLMLPSSPLRKAETVRRAWISFIESECDALMSVVSTSPPQWALKIENNRICPLFPDMYEIPRPKLTEAFRHDGGHLIVQVESMVKNRSFITGSVCPFTVDFMESVDVDTQGDLLWAEFLLQRCGG